MKILITGAAGGIGSSLGYYLHKHGHTLTLIDNFRNGYRENLYVDGKMFGDFRELDIRSTNLNEKLDCTYDCIIHLAAITSLPDCELNKTEAIDINVNGTLNVLEFARNINCPNVIFSSTSAVYENNVEDTFAENLIVTPSLFYSLSKKMAEDICVSYNHHYGMNVCILRLFNVFGPRQDIHRKNPPLINYIAKQIKNCNTVCLHGTGEQRRDYIHVDDVLRLIGLCLEKNPKGIYNVCTGTMLSVNEIFSIISKEYKYVLEPKYNPPSMLWDTYPELFDGPLCLNKRVVEKETNKYSKGSCEKTKNELDWQPNTNLYDLIGKTAREIYEIQ